MKKILYASLGERFTQKMVNFVLRRKIPFNEAELIYGYFNQKKITGSMIDVGAHFGETFKPYLDKKWNVIAFEPDPAKWESLKLLQKNNKLTFLPYAVSNNNNESVPFFVSPESSGISSLNPFVESHQQTGHVKVVTLKTVFNDYKIANIQYLKIDTEGNDLFVLNGFPWDKCRPEIIMCEFEDFKTKRLGYDYRNLGDFLIEKGYSVYLSEWLPVIKYGGNHQWLELKRYPCDLKDLNAWGNFIAVNTDEAKEYFDLCLNKLNKI